MGFIEWIENSIYTSKKAEREIDIVQLCIVFVEDQRKKLIENMKECRREQIENDRLIEKYLNLDIDSLFGVEKALYDNLVTKYKSIEMRMDFMGIRNKVLNDISEELDIIKNNAQALYDHGLYKEVITTIPEKLLPKMIANVKDTESIEKLIAELKIKLNEVLVKYNIVKEQADNKEKAFDAKVKWMNGSFNELKKQKEREQHEQMMQSYQKRKLSSVRAIDLPILMEKKEEEININKK